MPATATPADTAARAYRFQRFRTALLIDDLTFGPEAPGPGDQVPAFDLATLDGGRFSSSDLGGRPVLLAVGSRTCPVTESAGPVLRRLHAEYGDKVRFVLVNTREAHPGDLFGQPQTPGGKAGARDRAAPPPRHPVRGRRRRHRRHAAPGAYPETELGVPARPRRDHPLPGALGQRRTRPAQRPFRPCPGTHPGPGPQPGDGPPADARHRPPARRRPLRRPPGRTRRVDRRPAARSARQAIVALPLAPQGPARRGGCRPRRRRSRRSPR